MDTTIRRKNFPASGQQTSNRIRTSSKDGVRVEELSPAAALAAEKKNEMQFQYINIIFLSLIPPLLVLAMFCGKPIVFALFFGGIFSYIFDILGGVEATVLTIIATLMSIGGIIVFSGRHLLYQSVMNSFLIIVLEMSLVILFLPIAASFKMLLREFKHTFISIETLLFATIPIISASILTWFLCIELPSLDLSLTFSSIYCAYLYIFGRPRASSFSDSNKTAVNILSKHIVIAMYIIPVLFAPILHISLHFHVPIPAFHRIAGLCFSLLFPLILLAFVSEKHVDYWVDESTGTDIIRPIRILKYCLVGIAFVCLQAHPFFDEIKAISGFSDIFATVLACASCFILVLAYIIDEIVCGDRNNQSYDEGGIRPISWAVLITDRIVVFSWVVSSFIMCILVGMTSYKSIAVVLGGIYAMSEFYQKSSTSFIDLLYVAIGAFCIYFTIHMLTLQTLQFLDISLLWAELDVSIQLFSVFCCFLTALAVIIPSMLVKKTTVNEVSLGHIPRSQQQQAEGSFLGDLANILFCVFTFLVTACEFLVREQNWRVFSTDVETVYPIYLLGITAAIFIFTAIHLYSCDTIELAALWFVVIVQGCKSLHLLGFSSGTAFSAMALLSSTTLPFILYFKSGWSATSGEIDNGINFGDEGFWNPHMSIVEGICFALLSGISCQFSSTYLMPDLLLFVFGREVSETQVIGACAMIWCVFMGMLTVIFWRNHTLLRSVFFVLAAFSLLLTGEGLGPLVVEYDPRSFLLFTMSLKSQEENVSHAGIYMLFSFFLMIATFIDVISLRNPVSRLVYIVVYSLCTSQFVQEWLFPNSVDSTVITLDKGFFGFPHLVCLSSIFLATSTVLHVSSTKQITAVGNSISYLFTASILVAFLWNVFFGSHDLMNGLLWLGGLVHAVVVICCSILDFAQPNLSRGNDIPKHATFSAHVSFLSSVQGFLFLFAACGTTPHVHLDFAIPAIALLLLGIPKGTLIKDDSIVLVAISSMLWWVASAIYSLFIKDRNEVEFLNSFSSDWGDSFFADSEVSIWSTNYSAWFTTLHIVIFVLTLPTLYFSFINKSDSDDFLFFLALISLIPIIVSQVWSIRFLGILGTIFAAYRCYEIGVMQRRSDRRI